MVSVKVKMRSHQIHTSAQIEFAGADTEGSGDSVFQKQATIVSLHLNTGQIFPLTDLTFMIISSGFVVSFGHGEQLRFPGANATC